MAKLEQAQARGAPRLPYYWFSFHVWVFVGLVKACRDLPVLGARYDARPCKPGACERAMSFRVMSWRAVAWPTNAMSCAVQ